MQKTTRTMTRRTGAAALLALALGATSAAQAVVMEYQVMPGSSYERSRLDPATQLPVASASVALGGTFRVDTATGALLSAQFTLGDYIEYYDYAPLTPLTDYALVEHDDEVQNIAPASGALSGTTIGYSSWAATVGGSASCSSAGGAHGTTACAAAGVAAWSPFSISLLFTPDFSAVMGSANWTDSGATTDTHSLNLFAVGVAEVPVPGSLWLMGSGLAALVGAQRRSRARH